MITISCLILFGTGRELQRVSDSWGDLWELLQDDHFHRSGRTSQIPEDDHLRPHQLLPWLRHAGGERQHWHRWAGAGSNDISTFRAVYDGRWYMQLYIWISGRALSIVWSFFHNADNQIHSLYVFLHRCRLRLGYTDIINIIIFVELDSSGGFVGLFPKRFQ